MKSIKVKPFLFGLPMLETALAIGVGFALSYYVYPSLLFVFLCVLCSWAYGRYALSDYASVLRAHFGGPIKSELRISGLPLDFKETILGIIDNNELVIVTCPNNPFLRMGLKDYVYNRLGFIEFVDGESFQVDSKPLNSRTFLLSYGSMSNLQDAIAHLQNRGWKLHGDQGSVSNLIDRVYTQTMIYDP